MSKSSSKSSQKKPVSKNSSPSQNLCAVCARPINDDTNDSIICEGVCKDWMHRTCAGLSKAAFESARESPDDYFCHYCDSRCLKEEIKALKGRISSLEAELKAAPPANSPIVPSNVVEDSSKTSSNQRPNPYDQPKKFNINT